MTRERDRALASGAVRAVFGDRAGFALFLGVLCVVTLTWRVGLFITDNATLVHALDALSQGRFWIEPAGENALNAPGTSVRDGFVYGRNYGQLAFSLPALWGVRALDALVNLRVALVAGWHLLALLFAVQVGRVVDRERVAAVSGSVVVLISFFANVALATQFTTPSLALLALQGTAAVAAALIAVVLYRLLSRRHGTRIGLIGGAGAVLAMPLSFWGTVPKRHIFSSLFVVAILLAFLRSRESDGGVALPVVGTAPAYRALAYAFVGLLTWIHAAEGLFVFLALVAVDLPTAPTNDGRTLAFVGATFALSLLPVLVTNVFVTGEAVRPPRAMSGGVSASITEQIAGSTGDAAGGSAGGSGSGFGFTLLFSPVAVLVEGTPIDWITGQVLSLTLESLSNLAEPVTAGRTFVHSSVAGISQNDRFLGINLAMLEAAPVLGASVAAASGWLLGSARRFRNRLTATDALALAFALAFVSLYLNRLPLNTQVTVRYLLPVYPLGAFLLARSAAVRALVTDYFRPMLWSYGGGVAIGGQLLFVGLVTGGYAVGEAARVHALLGVALGLLVAALGVAGVLDERARPAAAVAFGLAGAAATVFFLLATAHYFSFIGEYVLPVVGAISELLGTAG